MPLSNVTEPAIQDAVANINGGESQPEKSEYTLLAAYSLGFFRVGHEFGDALLALDYTRQRYLAA
jgi:hypothetical protein